MIANKMLFLFVLISSTFAKENSDRIACDGVIFHDVYFDKELLFTNRGRPYNLVMHKYSGVLFFSHTIQNGTHIVFGITACQVEKRKCHDISGVPGGYAIAYDAGNDDIYFGGHNGIYTYNFMTKSAEFFAEQGKSIWGLFIKNHFYYIEYPSQKLFIYEDDTFVRVAEAEHIEIDNFFISKSNEIYYSNRTALYKIEKGNRHVVHLDDEMVVRQIAQDAYGDVFFLASDGIYLEEKPYHRVKMIAKITEAYGLTFDGNDHVVYSDKYSIYRLLPSNHSSLCYEAITKPKEVEKDEPYERLVPEDFLMG